MPTKEFIRDRRRGRLGQDYVAEVFKSWGLQVTNVPDGFFPGYDLTIRGKLHGYDINTAVEVKFDIRASETGRLYLDISALRHSKASILAIVTDNPRTVYIAPLQDVLNYALAHQNTKGGEYGEPACLITKDEFIQALKPKILTTNQ